MITDASLPAASSGLQKGALSWPMLAGLGIACVVSGDWAGWNYGLAQGGFGGLLIAVGIVALMYSCLCACMAEMATIETSAGGGAAFARRAFGPVGGFATGLAILLEYTAVPAAVAVFTTAAVLELAGIDTTTSGTWQFYVALPVIHLFLLALYSTGVQAALGATVGAAALSTVGLLVFIGAVAPHVDKDKLFDIPAGPDGTTGHFLPFGVGGVFFAVPFAMWFFLAVEATPLASEEAKDPATALPRAMATAMLVLGVLALLILTLAPASVGSLAIADSPNPLIHALSLLYGGNQPLLVTVNLLSICGLLASYASAVFAASRLTYDLAREGYLPRQMAYTSARYQAPILATWLPGLVMLGLALTGMGDQLILVAVLGALLSYVLMMATFIGLRRLEPNTPRPFTAPLGGIALAVVAIALAVVAIALSLMCLVAVFIQDVIIASSTVAGWLLCVLAFVAYQAYVRPAAYRPIVDASASTVQ